MKQGSIYILFGALIAGTIWSGAYFPAPKWVFLTLLLAAGAWELAGQAARRQLRLPRSPLFWLLAAGTALSAAGIIWSVSPGDTLRESLLLLAYVAAVYVTVSRQARDREGTRSAVTAWAVYTASFVSAWGIATYIFRSAPYTGPVDGIFRAGSTFEYSNALSCFGLMVLPLTAALWRRVSARERPLVVIAAALQVAAVCLSLSRFGAAALAVLALALMAAGWRDRMLVATLLALTGGLAAAAAALLTAEAGQQAAGLAAVILVFTVTYVTQWVYERIGEREDAILRAARWLLPVTLVAAAGGGLAALKLNKRVSSLISERFVEGFSFSRIFPHRLDTYAGAADAFRARPLAGSGLGTFAEVYQQYALARYTKFAHNLVLQAAVETGIVGAALMVLLLAYVLLLSLWRLVKSGEGKGGAALTLRRALALSLLPFIAYNLFDWEWYVPALTAWFVVLAACLEERG